MTKSAECRKTLGIIGGMGPLATADLFRKIVLFTDANSDAEHIHIVVDNNPKIPDRTRCIMEGSDAPFPFIRGSAKRLEEMGAGLLLLYCNTSHVFYQRLCKSVSIPAINMIEEASKQVSEMKFKKVGLLATNGTLHARLYETALKMYGIETVLPSPGGQAEIMRVIYKGIKAGTEQFDTSNLNGELRSMISRGAQIFLLGCTELPIAFERYNIAFPSIDPGVIMAKAAIIQAGYKIRRVLNGAGCRSELSRLYNIREALIKPCICLSRSFPAPSRHRQSLIHCDISSFFFLADQKNPHRNPYAIFNQRFLS